MRILSPVTQKELVSLFKGINVDSYGIKIMAPKGVHLVVKIDALTTITANILKQEMLSLGGDAAVSKDSLTGKKKHTDCFLMGTLTQYARLAEKLRPQPFGLRALGLELSRSLAQYQKESFVLTAGSKKIQINKRTLIMGIVNATPDSFSGDGIYLSRAAEDLNRGVDRACALVNDGADIIDIGGESSRPFSKPVSEKEEISRVIPLIKAFVKRSKVPVSIDTCKPAVAERALDNGAAIVNDITGLRNERMLAVVARYKAAVVIMHMQGTPRTMQKKPEYVSLLGDIIKNLKGRIDRAKEKGLTEHNMIVDPGIGFGKTLSDNLELLKHLRELKILGLPILAGPSRKSFIGTVLTAPPQERLAGTIAACVVAAKNGASILRVHDVKPVAQALKITDAIQFN